MTVHGFYFWVSWFSGFGYFVQIGGMGDEE